MRRAGWSRWPAESRMDGFGDDEFTLPPASDPREAWAAKTGAAAHVTVSGLLGFDDIEGGCSFLEAPDGIRYEVAYPDGWWLDRMRAELHGPDGRVARAGEPVTVHGSIATDRSSICQVGPILVASEVEFPPG